MSSFSLKEMEIRLTLSNGTFGPGNTKVITKLACEASIQKPGLPDFNKASIKIWGLRYNDMAKLTTLAFRPMENRNNRVAVFAGDASGLSQVFTGEVTTAHAVYGNARDGVFVIKATTGSYPVQMAAGPVCVKGSAQVGDIIAQQAKTMGYAFKNEGVTGSLSNTNIDG